MLFLTLILGSLLTAQTSTAEFINSIYYDQWHVTNIPGPNITAGINLVYLAFINPSELITNPIGNYTPFVSVESIKERFGKETKVVISVGGWSWTAPFADAAANSTSRCLFAENVATMLDNTGADGVDIDWEYPAGNGENYKVIPNDAKVSEITTYPLLLASVRAAIGPKRLLTIAVPGLKRDMIAYTKETVPQIAASVDYFNIMTYDLMNRRDNFTKHHTSVAGSLEAVEQYISLGLAPQKAILGFSFYAKWFTTDPKSNCATHPLGCATVPMEDALGNDNGMSGSLTFETANMEDVVIPSNLTVDPNGSCGAAAGYKCREGDCCSQYGFCGNTADYCGASCVQGYGKCTGPSITTSWSLARKNSIADYENGGEYYWDSSANIFWTWDTPTFIAEKFSKIVAKLQLGGIMSWSLGQDTYNNEHLLAIQQGVKNVTSHTPQHNVYQRHRRY